jgi:hypothetical protein
MHYNKISAIGKNCQFDIIFPLTSFQENGNWDNHSSSL